jgi:hypothetical protein
MQDQESSSVIWTRMSNKINKATYISTIDIKISLKPINFREKRNKKMFILIRHYVLLKYTSNVYTVFPG